MALGPSAGSQPPLAALQPGSGTTGIHGADKPLDDYPLDPGSSQGRAQGRADTSTNDHFRTQAPLPPAVDCPADHGNDNHAVESDH